MENAYNEKFGMTPKINYHISVLKEEESKDKIIVFDRFFNSDNKIIYTVDGLNRPTGVITVKNFLNCLAENSDNYVNKKFSKLYKKNKEEILQEAVNLAICFGITTGIPVVDDKGEILYEVDFSEMKKKYEDELHTYQDKFTRYAKSYYLRGDVIVLRQVLSAQKIFVIGNEKDFDKIFGDVWLDKRNVIFISDNCVHGYKLMDEHDALVVDLTITNHKGRNDIYSICHNGYGWNDFWNELLLQLELGNVGMLHQTLDCNLDIFEQFLEEYSIETLDINTNSLMTLWIVKRMRTFKGNLEIEKGLFRSESVKAKWKRDKINVEFIFDKMMDLCRLASNIIQWKNIYIQLYNRVTFLNFVCDIGLNLTASERDRFQNVTAVHKYFEDLEEGKLKESIYDIEKQSISYLNDIMRDTGIQQRRCFENDVCLFEDCYNAEFNIENGIRKTCGQPQEYIATIYIIGACTIFGSFSEDRYTVPSLIQEKINCLGKRYRVVNLGSIISLDYERLMKKIKILQNDIFIILYPMITDSVKDKIPIIDIGEHINVLREKYYSEKDIFLDTPMHCSDYGNKVYAEAIWMELKKILMDRSNSAVFKNNVYNLFQKDYQDLDVLYDFKQYLSEIRCLKTQIPMSAKKIGSVVMNCNPFTQGHRYLIEIALKEVDYLVVFVVEENKSYFSFSERMKMVKNGLDDLEKSGKVGIVRSGKAILSNITFAEYFNKNLESVQKKRISAVYDVVIFARYIAPELNILYRFVGEEPFDKITKQYNRDMKKVLIPFGICVREIPRRKSEDGNIISASRVRKLLEEGNIKELNKMLEPVTIKYLQNFFK